MIVRILLFILFVTIDGSTGSDHHGGDDQAQYKFAYGVHDPHTHDHKHQHEERHGKHVVGQYSLKEPDGTYRIVKYRAGPHTGFEAIVERIGHAHHPGHKSEHGHEGDGGNSYVGVFHWGNQGEEDHDEHGH